MCIAVLVHKIKLTRRNKGKWNKQNSKRERRRERKEKKITKNNNHRTNEHNNVRERAAWINSLYSNVEAKSVRHTLDNSIWISVYFILLSQRIHKIYINFEYVLFLVFFFASFDALFFCCFVGVFFSFILARYTIWCVCGFFSCYFRFCRSSYGTDKISVHTHSHIHPNKTKRNEKKINANRRCFVRFYHSHLNVFLLLSLSHRLAQCIGCPYCRFAGS